MLLIIGLIVNLFQRFSDAGRVHLWEVSDPSVEEPVELHGERVGAVLWALTAWMRGGKIQKGMKPKLRRCLRRG